MQQITSTQFKAAVELDPAWASKLTQPVEITDFCEMKGSSITHLSPLLHFTGKDEYGCSAYFTHCKSLKVAEGKFDGFVDFYAAAVERIGDLTCGKNERGNCANFGYCKFLKIAEGKFDGSVVFSESGIEKIKELSCGKDESEDSAYFTNCKSLKVAEGNFEGYVSFFKSSIEKIGDLSCGKNKYDIRLNVEACPKLTKIPITFDPEEIHADSKLIEKLEVDRFIKKKRAEIVEIEL